jgi:ribosomal protein S18 acetylase RimI-like enzyme
VTIVHAASDAEIQIARRLFREYEKSLGVDLCFQGFEQELASLPGSYAPPRGRLLLAIDDSGGDGGHGARGRAVGCVALRPLGDDVCEMKRLYLRAAVRGRGVGRLLAERIMEEGRAIGYRAMRLDTLPMMTDAIAMYRRLGFREIDPYYPNPVAGTLYMERAL